MIRGQIKSDQCLLLLLHKTVAMSSRLLWMPYTARSLIWAITAYVITTLSWTPPLRNRLLKSRLWQTKIAARWLQRGWERMVKSLVPWAELLLVTLIWKLLRGITDVPLKISVGLKQCWINWRLMFCSRFSILDRLIRWMWSYEQAWGSWCCSEEKWEIWLWDCSWPSGCRCEGSDTLCCGPKT